MQRGFDGSALACGSSLGPASHGEFCFLSNSNADFTEDLGRRFFEGFSLYIINSAERIGEAAMGRAGGAQHPICVFCAGHGRPRAIKTHYSFKNSMVSTVLVGISYDYKQLEQ